MTANRSYLWLVWGLALVGTVLDLGSKYAVFARLNPGPGESGHYELIPGAFELLTQHTPYAWGTDAGWLAPLRTLGSDYRPQVNKGAVFGLGGDFQNYANLLFALISLTAALAIVYWGTRPSTRQDRFLCASLGLILAGTLGNLYDRVVFHGVRDFLHWYYAFDWPVFNLADCCLVCGACLLLLQAFWAPAEEAGSGDWAEAREQQTVGSNP